MMHPSPPPDQATCCRCGKRPATHFICDGSAKTSSAFCDECVTSQNPLAASLMAEAMSAKCFYCGGSPCGGGTDSFSQLTGGPSVNRWMCMSCSPEYYSLMRTGFGKISSEPDSSAQFEEMRKLCVAVDEHMRDFVRRRDN